MHHAAIHGCGSKWARVAWFITILIHGWLMPEASIVPGTHLSQIVDEPFILTGQYMRAARELWRQRTPRGHRPAAEQ
jgi:hypothetical protein